MQFLQTLFNNIPDLLNRLISGLKAGLAFLYVRRSTQIETHKDALENASKIKNEQLDIAAGIPSRPGDLRDSMRNDKL